MSFLIGAAKTLGGGFLRGGGSRLPSVGGLFRGGGAPSGGMRGLVEAAKNGGSGAFGRPSGAGNNRAPRGRNARPPNNSAPTAQLQKNLANIKQQLRNLQAKNRSVIQNVNRNNRQLGNMQRATNNAIRQANAATQRRLNAQAKLNQVRGNRKQNQAPMTEEEYRKKWYPNQASTNAGGKQAPRGNQTPRRNNGRVPKPSFFKRFMGGVVTPKVDDVVNPWYGIGL